MYVLFFLQDAIYHLTLANFFLCLKGKKIECVCEKGGPWGRRRGGQRGWRRKVGGREGEGRKGGGKEGGKELEELLVARGLLNSQGLTCFLYFLWTGV